MDQSNMSTEQMQAQADAAAQQIASLQAELLPLNAELSRRHNARVFLLNQVIEGHAQSLRDNGVAESAIAEAEAFVSSIKSRNGADQGAMEGTS